MPDTLRPDDRAAIDAVVVRLLSGERIRAVSTDTGQDRTTDTTGELWHDGFHYRLRIHRRLRRRVGGWSPTTIEDRAFDEAGLRARLARDVELRWLAGLG